MAKSTVFKLLLNSIVRILLPFIFIYELLRPHTIQQQQRVNAFYEIIDSSITLPLPNIFIYLLNVLTGDWGISWSSGSSVNDLMSQGLQWLLLEIFLILSVAIGLSLLVIHLTKDIDNKNLYWIFSGKILFTVFITIAFVVSFSNYRTWVWDGFTMIQYVGSVSFGVLIVLASAFSSIQFLKDYFSTEMTILEDDEKILTYPENNDSIKITDKDISYHKFPSIVKRNWGHTLGYYMVISRIFNLPNISRSFFRGYALFDLPLLFGALFVLLLVHGIYYFLIDLACEHIKKGETVLVPKQIESRAWNITGKITFGLIILFLLFTVYFFILVSFNSLFTRSYTSFLYNPRSFKISDRNLPAFTGGYLLGTDSLGRDVFSLLIFSMFGMVGPVIFGLLFRYLVVRIIESGWNRIPRIGYILHWMSNIPKLPILIVLVRIQFYDISVIIFYLLAAVFFTPHSMRVILTGIENPDASSQLNFFKNRSSLYYHLFVSILVEAMLIMILVFDIRPNSPTNSYGAILNNQFLNFPTARPVQSFILVIFPALLIMFAYLKVDTN